MSQYYNNGRYKKKKTSGSKRTPGYTGWEGVLKSLTPGAKTIKKKKKKDRETIRKQSG